MESSDPPGIHGHRLNYILQFSSTLMHMAIVISVMISQMFFRSEARDGRKMKKKEEE
jgi:hypothetical protein